MHILNIFTVSRSLKSERGKSVFKKTLELQGVYSQFPDHEQQSPNQYKFKK